MVTLWRPHPTGFHPYRKGDIGLSPLDPLCQKRKKAGQSPDGLKNTPRAKARGVFQRSKPSGSSPSWLIPQNIRNNFPLAATRQGKPSCLKGQDNLPWLLPRLHLHSCLELDLRLLGEAIANVKPQQAGICG